MLPPDDMTALAAGARVAARPDRLCDSRPQLRVDPGAIVDNFREARRRLGPAKLSAVLKSDAYGLGLAPIASALASAGCGEFWVNDLDEAIRLRRLLPDATIYTLMGLAGAHIRDFVAAQVLPALVSTLEIEHCARHALAAQRRVPVAIQFDTGLGRLGLCEDDARFLALDRSLLDGLDVRLYVTHLAAYNLPDDEGNDAQRRRLGAWISALPPAPVSLGASSAVFMAADWHFDMARVGSALLGVQTSVAWQNGLRPCYELSAPLLTIADHPAGRSLGYRGVSRLARPSRIATVAIGYSNGLPQGLAAFGAASIGGYSAPIVGGIAMNMTMVDVTDVPDAALAQGRWAVFFDAAQPLEPAAERLGCAPNMLLTQIGAGTHKIYW